MRSFNKSPWLLLALIAVAFYGYLLYEKFAARRGSIALVQFETLAEAVDAEARYKFVELTKGGLQDTVSRYTSGHNLAKADLSYTWDLIANDPAVTNFNFTAIATAIKSKLSSRSSQRKTSCDGTTRICACPLTHRSSIWNPSNKKRSAFP